MEIISRLWQEMISLFNNKKQLINKIRYADTQFQRKNNYRKTNRS
jgi:hypothetical protein